MANWWKGVALITAWGCIPILARAQYLPVSGGPAPIQEPTPIATAPTPTKPPPKIPEMPEPGIPPLLTDKTFPIGGERGNAFGTQEEYNEGACQNFGDGCAWYMSMGSITLKREHPGSQGIAVQDPQTIDTGNPPPLGSPEIENVHNLNPNFVWGGQGTLGYRWDNQAIEVSGFYLPHKEVSHVIANPGRIDIPFVNFPLGFEGDNGMWLQADRNRIALDNMLASGEFNYRFSPSGGAGMEVLAGIRYLDLQERFSIFTDDDGLTVFPPDPFRMATYSVHAHNHILGLQLGVDWEYPLRRWLAMGFFAKGDWGANFVDVDINLTRGDGFIGPIGHNNRTIFAQFYESGVFLDWYVSDRIRVRTGYNALWVLDVAEAVSQVNYDLSISTGTRANNGSIFYHGPVFELHFLF